jgi:O-antigen/teichoic acid export membrane protein
VAGKGAFFLVTVIAARRLSQHGFGLFSLATTIGWMAAVATDSGMQLHLAREVARRPDEAPRLLRFWIRARLWTSALAIATLALALVASSADRRAALAVLLIVIVYVAGGLVEFLHHFYRGWSRSDIESTLTLSLRFGTLACAVVALAWRPDLVTLAAAMLLPMLLVLAYSWRRASRMAAARDRTPPERGDDSSRWSLPAALGDVVPIGLGIVLSALYFRIDVFLLELWTGTTAVALYNAVFRLVDALRLFPAAVLAVTLPALVRASNARPLLTVSAIVTMFSTAVAVVLWIAAGWLVPRLYGEAYAGAVPAFRILLAALPLMSLNYALTHQLIGWNLHRAYAAVCGLALLFNVALNARLIPSLAMAGAAWTTVATEGLLTLGCVTVLRLGSAHERQLTVPVLP